MNPSKRHTWEKLMTNLLEVKAIHTFINQFQILEGVSLEVEQGSITALLGRNGAGKTTTLRSIIGLNPPREGQIVYAGEPIQGKTAYQIAMRGIGYVPEYRAIFRALTVEENLRIAERKKGDLARRSDLIFELFPDLQRFYHLPGGQLSGGQQQMLAIARALVPENRLLLVDEPSEGLAPIIIESIVGALRQLSSHMTVLLVEQNFRMASKLADRYYILDDGQTVNTGRMVDLVKDRPLITKYLGAGYVGTGQGVIEPVRSEEVKS
jgi:branched-chain amino acid transport system ATP-binding protein